MARLIAVFTFASFLMLGLIYTGKPLSRNVITIQPDVLCEIRDNDVDTYEACIEVLEFERKQSGVQIDFD